MAKQTQEDTVRSIVETSSSSLPSLVPVTRTSVPSYDSRTLSPLSISSGPYTPLTSPSNTLDLSTASVSNLHMQGNSLNSRKTSSLPYNNVPGGLSNSSSVYQSMQSLNDRYLRPAVSLSSRMQPAGSTGAPGGLALPGFHTLTRTSSLPNVPGQTYSPGKIAYQNVYQIMRHSSMVAMNPGLAATPVSRSQVGRNYTNTSEVLPANTNRNVALTEACVTQSPSGAPCVNLFPRSSNMTQGSSSSIAAGVGLSTQNSVGVPYNGNIPRYGSAPPTNLQTVHSMNTYGGVPNANVTNMPIWTNISDARGNAQVNIPSGGNSLKQRSVPNTNLPMATNDLTQGRVSNVNMYSGSNVSMAGGVQNTSASAGFSVSAQGVPISSNMLYGSNSRTHGNAQTVNMAGDNVPQYGRANLLSGGTPPMNFPPQLRSRLSAIEGNVERLVLANKLNGNSQDPLVLDPSDILNNIRIENVESLHQLLENFTESERNLPVATYNTPNPVNESVHVPSTSLQSSVQGNESGRFSSTGTSSTNQKQPYLTGDDLIRAAADFSQIPTNLTESDVQNIPNISGENNGYELDVNLTIVHDGSKEKQDTDFEDKAVIQNYKLPGKLMSRSQVNALHKSVSLYWPDFSGYPTSCICEPGVGKEIAVEQIWMHEKQLYFMPQIEIITIGNQELVGIIKTDNVYVSVGQIFLHLLPEMRKEIENYLVTKECDRAFLSLEEMAYLQQRKCININSATIISLASLRAMCTSLLEGKSFVDSPTINLYEAANGAYFRKILSNHTKCSNCGGSMRDETIPDDYEEFDNPEVPLSNNAMKEAYQNLLTKRTEERKKNLDNVVQKDGENMMKEIKVGTTTVGHVHFNVFVMDGKMYISIRELILSKVMTIHGLQSRLVELKYKPRPAPSTVDLYFISENIDVDNTLWVDLETLRCVCCIKVATPKAWNMEVYNRLKLKQYTFREDATFQGEDDCAWEGVVYTLNTHTFKIATTKRLTSKIVELPPKNYANKEKNIPKRVRSRYGKEKNEGILKEDIKGQSVEEILSTAGGSRRNKVKNVKDVKAVKTTGDPVYMSITDVLKPGYYVFKDKESIQRFLNSSSPPPQKDNAGKTKESLPSKDVVQILDFGSQSSDSSPIKHKAKSLVEKKREKKTNNSKVDGPASMSTGKKKRGKKGISTLIDPKNVKFNVIPARPDSMLTLNDDENKLPAVDKGTERTVCKSLKLANAEDSNIKVTNNIDGSKLVGSKDKQQDLPKLTITLSRVSHNDISVIKKSLKETKGRSDITDNMDQERFNLNDQEVRSTERSKEKEDDVLDLSTKSSSSFESSSKKCKRKREHSSEGKTKRKRLSSLIQQGNGAANLPLSSPSLESEDDRDFRINVTIEKEISGTPIGKKHGPKAHKSKTVEEQSVSKMNEREVTIEGTSSLAGTQIGNESFTQDLNSEGNIGGLGEPNISMVNVESKEMQSPERKKHSRKPSVQKERQMMSQMNDRQVTVEGTDSIAVAYGADECCAQDLNSEGNIKDSHELNTESIESNKMKSPKGRKPKDASKPSKGEKSRNDNPTMASAELSDTCFKHESLPVAPEEDVLLILDEATGLFIETYVGYDIKETKDVVTNIGYDVKETKDATKNVGYDKEMEDAAVNVGYNVKETEDAATSAGYDVKETEDAATSAGYDVKETEDAASSLDQYMQNEEENTVYRSPCYTLDVSHNDNSGSQEVKDLNGTNSDNTQLEEAKQHEGDLACEKRISMMSSEMTESQTVQINNDIAYFENSTPLESRTKSAKNKKSHEKESKKHGRKKGEKMKLLSSKPKKSDQKKHHVENKTEAKSVDPENNISIEGSFDSSDKSMADVSLSHKNSVQGEKFTDLGLVSPERSVLEEVTVQNGNSVCDTDSKTNTDEGECDVDIDYYEKHPMETKGLLKKLYGILDNCVDFNGNFINGFDVSNFYLKPGAEEYFPCLIGDDLERRNHLLDTIYEAFKNVCNLPAVSKELHQIDADVYNFVDDEVDDKEKGSKGMDKNTDSTQDNVDMEADLTSPPMSRDYMQSLGLIESSKLHLLSPPRRLRSNNSEMQIKLLEMDMASKDDKGIKDKTKKIKGNKINKLTSLKSKQLMPRSLKGYHVSAHRRLQDAILAKSGKLVKCTQGLKELKNLCIEMNEGSGKLRSGVFKRSPKQGNKSDKGKQTIKKEKCKSESERSRSVSPHKKEKERSKRSRSLEKLGKSSEKVKKSKTKTLRQSRSLDSLKRKTNAKSEKMFSKVKIEIKDRNSRSRVAKTKAESLISGTTNANGSEQVLTSEVKKKDSTSIDNEFGLKKAYVSLQRENLNKTLKKDAGNLTGTGTESRTSKNTESKVNYDKTVKHEPDAELSESMEMDKLNSGLETKGNKDDKQKKHSSSSVSMKTHKKVEKLGRNAARIIQSQSLGKAGILQRSPPGSKMDVSRLATEVITAREAKRRKKLMQEST